MECRDEYAARMDRVLRYIDTHLDGDLSLARLAAEADFSPYHFHRVFKAMTGETVHAYAKRMRLKSAAVRLRHSPRPDVARIALDLGFESPSDFSRSFRAAYHVSPSSFARHDRGLLDGDVKPAGHTDRALEERERAPASPREVTVRTIEDGPIAYIRCAGLSKAIQSISIERAYARLFAWAKARDLVGPDTRVIGVTLDSPEAVPLAKCRFNACITVPEGVEAPDGILLGRLGASGKYACMTFVRRDPRYSEVFFSGIEYLYKTWLPDSGFVPDDKPFLELYREEVPGNGKLMVDFCVPLRPL
jgi:AraC family transcriptional regulator